MSPQAALDWFYLANTYPVSPSEAGGIPSLEATWIAYDLLNNKHRIQGFGNLRNVKERTKGAKEPNSCGLCFSTDVELLPNTVRVEDAKVSANGVPYWEEEYPASDVLAVAPEQRVQNIAGNKLALAQKRREAKAAFEQKKSRSKLQKKAEAQEYKEIERQANEYTPSTRFSD